MEVKHRRCFGPCLVETWHLEAWKEKILDRWNEINLYSMTRGINRFLALEKMLTEVNEAVCPIEGLEDYSRWCETTESFSNAMIEKEIRAGNHPIFRQALDWSMAVNRRIEEISEEILPFSGVKEALEQMKKYADIAIVSSANPQAVEAEWTRFGFMDDVDYVMAQDAGTKADCIGRMIGRGYEKTCILVLGDAPGDARAAADNGTLYYPILAGHEVRSWAQLRAKALPRLIGGTYDAAYQEELLMAFYRNLGSEEK